MEKELYQFYIKTRPLLGISASLIYEEQITVYGAQAISYSTVQR